MSKMTQLNYDELQRISKSLRSESEEIVHLHASTRQKVEALRGNWVGDAANAFFREQEGQLLPAVQRVSRALNDSETVLNQIMRIIHDADQETAGYFRNSGDYSPGMRAHIMPALPRADWLRGVHAEVFGGKTGGILENTGEDGKFETGKPKWELTGKIGREGQVYEGRGYTIGKWDVGAKFGVDENGRVAGVYGEFDAFKTSATGLIGSTAFGFTPTVSVAAGSVEGFAGYKDHRLGASVGTSLISGEVGLGFNVAGFNVRAVGGVAAGVEFGGIIGPDTRVKLGPFRVGLSFGKAITNSINGQPR